MENVKARLASFVGNYGIIIVSQIGNATVVARRKCLECMLRQQFSMQRVADFNVFGRVREASFLGEKGNLKQ